VDEALIEVSTMRRFVGIDRIRDRIPVETTILTFRHLLERPNLGERIFETVKAHLLGCGMAVEQGTIIDATLIAALSSTSSKAGERDRELHQTKKRHQWNYGMKVHIGVDKDLGLIHSVEATAANVHDLTPIADLLHGEEDVSYQDAGCQGVEKRPQMAGRVTKFRVAKRPGMRRVLPDSLDGRLRDLIEAAKAHIRCKDLHPFRMVKQLFGFPTSRL
jgi:IS5 family transposase